MATGEPGREEGKRVREGTEGHPVFSLSVIQALGKPTLVLQLTTTQLLLSLVRKLGSSAEEER